MYCYLFVGVGSQIGASEGEFLVEIYGKAIVQDGAVFLKLLLIQWGSTVIRAVRWVRGCWGSMDQVVVNVIHDSHGVCKAKGMRSEVLKIFSIKW